MSFRVATCRFAFHRGTAGETEAEQGRHLVERFAGRVVDGGAEQIETQGGLAMAA
jgi:hypothetical protein